ncbi:hypothetical protein C8R44DRAFT_957522 [Mycena epipterygia]|nr:hypothetical protein C8R44DRAFT_957522 [Mycena epipterygia]
MPPQISVSASGTVPDVLPDGFLDGHYSRQQQLYTVYSGSSDIVLNTPTPAEAPPIDSSTINPLLRQPRYLSFTHPYLMFIPRHYAWRDELFEAFNCPRHKLPIIQDGDKGFTLQRDVAETWLRIEVCLRALGREMLQLAPNRLLRPLVNPWFFPSRFKFMQHFGNEASARFATWRSIENFLPLLGYVSMGFWVMQCWEYEELDKGAEPPDWRSIVAEKTKIHPVFLDYLQESVVGNWKEERVGTLYRIQAPEEVHYKEREGRREIEWLLGTIMHSGFPIPVYLSWGKLPREISSVDVPAAFRWVAPDAKELECLASPHAQLKFSRWSINSVSGMWYRDPYTAPVAPAPSSPSLSTDSTLAVAPAPFPPLPPHSQQKKNESIQAFFIRRREANQKTMAKENHVDRQRRTQRADHAKRGGVPSKARVFVWEEQDGHYIRQPGGRGAYAQLWDEYPHSQRRFDPISNEWDLCELFADNDPVFGETSNADRNDEDDDDDDDDDDYDMDHPTFPQNIDIASRLARDDNSMEVVQTQRLQNLEMVSIDDVPEDEDLGPDFTESDLPTYDLAEASKKCVNLLYLKFGFAPRTEKPEYEPCARTLLGVLQMRFGFVLPQSPEKFVARDPPKAPLKPELVAKVVGMADIGGQLASEKGLANILGVFFGQCIKARSVHDIDRFLLDYHQSQRFPRGNQFFEIRREHLKSMHDPSQYDYYYVVCKPGSGIGSEVLLIPRATDALEVLRQGWGPDIRDVSRHFLARGIPFWHAYVSAEIMPEREMPASLKHRPKGFKADISSGLGLRPEEHVFDEYDYNAYVTQRDLRLLHTPRGFIALQYGGVIGRLARSEVSDDEFFRGFNDDMYDVGGCLWDGSSPHAYWHNRLSDHEIDLLCGVYHVATGQRKTRDKGQGKQEHGQGQSETEQTGIISWWPRPNAWARGSLDGAWWTPQCEDDFYVKRLGHFAKGVYRPQHPSNWRHNLKFKKEVKKCWDGYEVVAASILQGLIAQV